MVAAGLLTAAYLLGSLPSGYLLVRAVKGLDVRQYGSHNIGAINVGRVGGLWLALATLCADAGKAALVVVVSAARGMPAPVIAGAAFLVLLGHACSLWFLIRERRISEGKSVACALGTMIGLAAAGVLTWPLALAPLGVWLCGLLAPRLLTGRWYCISPATMLAAISIPIAIRAAGSEPAYVWLGVAMAALILVRHKQNLRRLRAGTEPRLHAAARG